MQNTRFLALDALRGVCACMVALLHFQTTGYLSSSRLVAHAYLFVDFFFVLSGFVIAASYGEKLRDGFSVWKFMLLRLGRIYPLYFATLLAFMAWEVTFALIAPGMGDRAAFTGDYTIESFFWSLGLVQIFFGNDQSFWNGPSWSIAAEVWTYLLFAPLFRLQPKRLVVVVALGSILSLLYVTELGRTTHRHLAVVHDGALARCIGGFGLGVIVHEARRYLPELKGAVVNELMAVAAIISGVAGLGGTPWEMFNPLVFAGVLFIFSYQAGPFSRVLITPPFLLLGTLSYSIYMVHAFVAFRIATVAKMTQRIIGSTFVQMNSMDHEVVVGNSRLSGDIASLLFLALVIVIARLTYRTIERPGREWSRRVVLTARPARPIQPQT